MKPGLFFLPTALIFISELIFISCLTAPVPMRVVYHNGNKNAGGTLIVFLPGNRSTPEEFDTEGFTGILKKYLPGADSLAVDAPIGYYISQTLPDRLLEDVIRPARQKGYTRIWLVGISMGGSGALWYLKTHPETVRGALLLAPFLADKKIVEEIENAGGLMKWSPAAPEKNDYQRAQLVWLKRYINRQGPLPRLSIGFGESDRFERSNRIVAAILPARDVFKTQGKHDWKTWRVVFEQFMKSGLMP
jgi:pimeloyl-ACP methyl ester carboxylesterase